MKCFEIYFYTYLKKNIEEIKDCNFIDGRNEKTSMESSSEEDSKVSLVGSRQRLLSTIPKSSRKKASLNSKSSPLLETTLEWLRSITPRKLREYESENVVEHMRGASSTETLIKKKKILTLYAKDDSNCRKTLNLYEAFGTTAKKTAPVSGFHPLLVIEVNENGMLKGNHVPYKYSMEGKWLLYGKRIYVLKGHSFLEHKSSPTFVTCLLCVTTGFRLTQNFFQCMDCEYVCSSLLETAVTTDCPVAKILTQEMNFPYDVTETKTEKVQYLRIA